MGSLCPDFLPTAKAEAISKSVQNLSVISSLRKKEGVKLNTSYEVSFVQFVSHMALINVRLSSDGLRLRRPLKKGSLTAKIQ